MKINNFVRERDGHPSSQKLAFIFWNLLIGIILILSMILKYENEMVKSGIIAMGGYIWAGKGWRDYTRKPNSESTST